MTGRLAIDFGTSNTVVALWDGERKQGTTPVLTGLSTEEHHDGHSWHAIPSLIHYEGHQDGKNYRVRVGRQVLDEGLDASTATFCWMKTYLCNGRKLPRRIDGRVVDIPEAAADFLGQVLTAAGGLTNLADEEIAITVPVEGFEHYQNWLDETLRRAGVEQPRFIDEASAAAMGYSARVRSGEAFMVFDFGGGTIDASIVVVEERAGGGRRCRLLGKAGAQVGGSLIDAWIMKDVIARSGRTEAQVRGFSGLLLREAERVKKALTFDESGVFVVMDPSTGSVVERRLTRGNLEELLEENGLYTRLATTLDLTEAQALERGYGRDRLVACLMVGGSSLIPSVRRLVRTRYGPERTRCERPFDAVALGAAAYVAGMDFDDRIRHGYALKHYDRAKDDYGYTPIVAPGTPFPCKLMRLDKPKQELVLTMKAAHDEQTRLGLEIYEVSHRESVACGGTGLDLVFDQNGAAQYTRREDVEDATRRRIGSATFIAANPAAKRHDPRFPATFAIDGQKRLCITVRDILTGKTLLRDHPMVKLT